MKTHKRNFFMLIASVAISAITVLFLCGYFAFTKSYSYEYDGVCISSSSGYAIQKSNGPADAEFYVIKYNNSRAVIHVGQDFKRIYFEDLGYHDYMSVGRKNVDVDVLAESEPELVNVKAMVHPCRH